MGPGLYSDIGRKAKDLLYNGYHTDQKFTLSTYTSEKVAVTIAGIKKNELVFGEIISQIRNKSSTIDVRANSDSNLVTTVTINELMKPGLKGIFSLVVPDQKSGKVELQYLHEYAGLTVTAGLMANPVVGMSAVFGTGTVSFGADVAFDTATSNLTRYNAGMSLAAADFIASLTLNNQGDSLNASYYHLVHPVTAVGGEVAHRFSSNATTISFGAQHAIDPLTMVKARVNSYGIASALLQHAWHPKSILSVSAEMDLTAADSSPMVGLSLLLRP